MTMLHIRSGSIIVGSLISISTALFAKPVAAQMIEFKTIEGSEFKHLARKIERPDFRRTFTRLTKFHLPVQMDMDTREKISEVELHVKDGKGEWRRSQTIKSNEPFFTYAAPGDGEYWLAIVTIDKKGRRTPNDLELSLPIFRLVIDTTAPTIKASVIADKKGRILKVELEDANPDLTTVRAFAKINGSQVELERKPGDSLFLVPTEAADSVIRVTASDQAHNEATIEVLPKVETATTICRQASLPLRELRWRRSRDSICRTGRRAR